MTDNGAHHVPDPQDDGSRADMAAQAAAGGEPAVPRGYHLFVPVYLLLERFEETSFGPVCETSGIL